MSTPNSPLFNAVTGDDSQAPAAPIPQADPAALQSAATGGVTTATQAPSQPAPAQSGSRLGAIVQAVANVASTAMQGIPDKGRSSFVTGLGEGARAEANAQANLQAVKFKTFADQVRLAQLHNQDLKLQNDTQAQTDAHTKAEIDNRALAAKYGLDYDTLANHGPSVMEHLTAQTAANGAASAPAGTHVSADGNTIYIPKDPDSQATKDAQRQMYNAVAPVVGLPSLNPASDVRKAVDMLTNVQQGFQPNGTPYNHDQLPGVIGAGKALRDQLAKNGGSPEQLKFLDNRNAILQANLDYLDEHKAGVLDAASQRKQDEQTNQIKQKGAQQRLTNSQKPQKAQDNTELNAVAFDPNYQNADGTKGANVVMSKTDAAAKGLPHYKADANKINTVVAGMNDVQNKLNQLADVANNRQAMAQVDPGLAAAMLAHGKGITLEFGGHGSGASGGVGVDTSRINEDLYSHDVMKANQATRDYVTAMIGAHEAITQLPRLQTFGQSNRMTEKQMEAAVNLLPQPGDREFAAQKMTSLQGMIDPLRKQIPHMPGAESTPSWLEKRQTPSGASNLGRAAMGNATDIVKRLQPSN